MAKKTSKVIVSSKSSAMEHEFRRLATRLDRISYRSSPVAAIRWDELEDFDKGGNGGAGSPEVRFSVIQIKAPEQPEKKISRKVVVKKRKINLEGD